jgi:hypothetical protein
MDERSHRDRWPAPLVARSDDGTCGGPLAAADRREADIDALRALLLQGVHSGPGVVADEACFAALRERARWGAARQRGAAACSSGGSNLLDDVAAGTP